MREPIRRILHSTLRFHVRDVSPSMFAVVSFLLNFGPCNRGHGPSSDPNAKDSENCGHEDCHRFCSHEHQSMPVPMTTISLTWKYSSSARDFRWIMDWWAPRVCLVYESLRSDRKQLMNGSQKRHDHTRASKCTFSRGNALLENFSTGMWTSSRTNR